MPTTNVGIGYHDYTLITSEISFIAQNRHEHAQEWVRADALPASTLVGIRILPGQGMSGDVGNGNLYGKGGGRVVVVS